MEQPKLGYITLTSCYIKMNPYLALKLRIHYPKPFHAFYLVPSHHSSCKMFWLLKGYWLSIVFPNWVKEEFSILPNCLRQPIFNHTIRVFVFLKIFYTEIRRGAFIL